MKNYLSILILGSLFFLNRSVMADLSHQPILPNWVSIQDKKTGLRAEFPHHPFEMNIDLPFQNTPPKGELRFISAPTSGGLLAVSTFLSPLFNAQGLQKKLLKDFFTTVLVPHFFFNPAVFQDHQTYQFQKIETEEQQEAASFQFSFKDQEEVKRIQGKAIMQDETLYVAFYLTSESSFDQDLYTRFLESIRIPVNFEE